MNSKKKMIVAITAVVLVVLATIVTVIAVLAAQNVTIQSTIDISYNVENVYGSARVTYKLGSDEYKAWNNAEGYEVSDFTNGDVDSFTLGTVPFVLTAENSSVIIKFEFQKSSSIVDNYTVGLVADITEIKNIELAYGTTEDVTNKIDENTQNVTSEDLVLFDKENHLITVSYTDDDVDNDWQAFYVKISIKQVSADADFSGNLKWTLTNTES